MRLYLLVVFSVEMKKKGPLARTTPTSNSTSTSQDVPDHGLHPALQFGAEGVRDKCKVESERERGRENGGECHDIVYVKLNRNRKQMRHELSTSATLKLYRDSRVEVGLTIVATQPCRRRNGQYPDTHH